MAIGNFSDAIWLCSIAASKFYIRDGHTDNSFPSQDLAVCIFYVSEITRQLKAPLYNLKINQMLVILKAETYRINFHYFVSFPN